MKTNSRTSKLFIMLLTIFLSFETFAEQGEWRKVLENDEITIFSKSRGTKGYNEVMGEMHFGSPEHMGLVEIFMNPDQYSNWIFGVGHSAMLKKLNYFDYLVYMIADLPRPAKDRDCMARVSFFKDSHDGATVVYIDHLPGLLPEQKGIVRTEVFESRWRLTPDPERGDLKLSIDLYAEPSGLLPAFIVNLFFKHVNMFTMKNIPPLMESIQNTEAHGLLDKMPDISTIDQREPIPHDIFKNFQFSLNR
jgi:hypothetical protein